MTYAVLSRTTGGQIAAFSDLSAAIRHVLLDIDADDNDWALVRFGADPSDNEVIAIPTDEDFGDDGLMA